MCVSSSKDFRLEGVLKQSDEGEVRHDDLERNDVIRVLLNVSPSIRSDTSEIYVRVA